MARRLLVASLVLMLCSLSLAADSKAKVTVEPRVIGAAICVDVPAAEAQQVSSIRIERAGADGEFKKWSGLTVTPQVPSGKRWLSLDRDVEAGKIYTYRVTLLGSDNAAIAELPPAELNPQKMQSIPNVTVDTPGPMKIRLQWKVDPKLAARVKGFYVLRLDQGMFETFRSSLLPASTRSFTDDTSKASGSFTHEVLMIMKESPAAAPAK